MNQRWVLNEDTWIGMRTAIASIAFTVIVVVLVNSIIPISQSIYKDAILYLAGQIAFFATLILQIRFMWPKE